ncbi:MAG TPA: Trm112 family protein [Gemmatimonadaceae bacterium]|nr:Trm112 family protein [Gemmatimonadaceae bacterium]
MTPPTPAKLSAQLLAILVCPKCRGKLDYREAESVLDCRTCRLRYSVRDGIPILLIEEAVPLS